MLLIQFVERDITYFYWDYVQRLKEIKVLYLAYPYRLFPYLNSKKVNAIYVNSE